MIHPIKVFRYGKEFIVNGCTGITFYIRDENGDYVLKDGRPIVNVCAEQVCVDHDIAYSAKLVSRREADLTLLRGWIKCKVPTSEAKLAYAGVRIGGWIQWLRS